MSIKPTLSQIALSVGMGIAVAGGIRFLVEGSERRMTVAKAQLPLINRQISDITTKIENDDFQTTSQIAFAISQRYELQSKKELTEYASRGESSTANYVCYILAGVFTSVMGLVGSSAYNEKHIQKKGSC